ncbi:Predicted ferric reductase [Thermodesulforhabdus norvegica]|uniref:Predicted ferric reductase n=2 Tax=Thermodesulforhabdus norvegica TaxID=39841 RepID=A0A1I4TGL4_9BACT|nr:Predicted ferric reductase [Thermodesulforhabdus norvegica]
MWGLKFLRFLWCILAFLLFVIVVVAWGVEYVPGFLKAPWGNKLGGVGNLFGLLALYTAVIMTVIGVRLPLVERAFGLDRLIRFHTALGPLVLLFAIIHVIFRTLSFSASIGEKWSWDFLFQFFPYSWAISENALVAARWGLLVILLSVTAAKVARLSRGFIPFRIWKPLHSMIYYGIFTAFGHSLILASDVKRFPLLVPWAGLALVWGGCCVYRLNYLLQRSRNFRWFLEGVDYETHDVHTCRFIRPEGQGSFARRRPGQFMIIRMKSRLWGWSDPHPFTISCPPGSDSLCCTVKGVGSFSKKLRTCRPGTVFLCEGPYGIFTPDFEREKNLVFIAGGIGITPFLSMMRYVRDNSIPVSVTLIWGNRAKKDIVAYSELSRFVKSSDRFRVVHVLSEQKITDKMREETAEDGFFWEQGLVTGSVLKKYVNPDNASFYVCGPAPMQKMVMREIRQVFKVPPGKIRRELFVFY